MLKPFLLSSSTTYQTENFHIFWKNTICALQHVLISVQVNLTWLLLTMEVEIEKLQSLHSLRIPRISSIGRDSEVNDKLEYTSLKDIICNTPTKCSALLYEGNDFDSNITIRNELVKRAASVYLQSAALLATRNQNCFVNFWERIKSKAASCSCWRVSGGNVIRAYLWPIFEFLNHIVGSLRSLP